VIALSDVRIRLLAWGTLARLEHLTTYLQHHAFTTLVLLQLLYLSLATFPSIMLLATSPSHGVAGEAVHVSSAATSLPSSPGCYNSCNTSTQCAPLVLPSLLHRFPTVRLSPVGQVSSRVAISLPRLNQTMPRNGRTQVVPSRVSEAFEFLVPASSFAVRSCPDARISTCNSCRSRRHFCRSDTSCASDDLDSSSASSRLRSSAHMSF